ncbi:MAG: LysR family transcriptional regulator [Pseudonocardiaceae bacterium]
MAELELRHLRAVRAVAEAGSVTKAAARLGLSQPALTAQLRRIEGLLGGQLFERGVHGAAPTELGRFVLNRAMVLLSDMDQLVASVKERGGAERNPVLRVASVTLLMVGGFIDEVRGTGDWFDLRTMVEGSATVLRLLETGHADVGLFERFDGYEGSSTEGLHVRRLVVEPVLVAVSEHDPLAQHDEIELGALADRDWVVPPPHEDSQRAAFLGACEAAGFTPRMRHFTSDTSSARSLVQRGAVSTATGQSKSGGGIVVRRLVGDPLLVELLFGARADAIGQSADVLFACAARAYLALLDRNPDLPRWWEQHPEAHGELDAALGR